MKAFPVHASIAAATILLACRIGAGQAAVHSHPEAPPENFGSILFPVSCGAAAQKEFERSVTILHSFGYEMAEASFRRILETDPHCAMAWWGVAMSRYHPLWYPPTPDDLKVGREAVT